MSLPTPLGIVMLSLALSAQGEIEDKTGIVLTDQFQSLLANDNTSEGWSAKSADLPPKHQTQDTQAANEIFTVKGDLIHVYADAKPNTHQPIATFTTDQSFSEYVFEIDYRWLGPRFHPRANAERDAGVLFHLHKEGPKRVWPVCIECQIGESKVGGKYVSGDLWIIGKENRLKTTQANKRFKPSKQGGELVELGGKAYIKGGVAITAAKPELEAWNTVRLIVKADEYAIFQINDQTVNEIYQIERKVDGEWLALREGPISLQAEYAEMYYRNPRIRKILPRDTKPSWSNE